MHDYDYVAGRYNALLDAIGEAANRASRSMPDIEIMAVTKLHPVEAAHAAYNLGIRRFGESRVQEAEAKYPGFKESHPGSRVEMIGHLQSNKAKKASALFDSIQSVDSQDLIGVLSRIARSAGRPMNILLELHTGEESKSGFTDTDSLIRAAECAAAEEETGGLVLRGFMTMAPLTDDEGLVRASFRKLRSAMEGIVRRFGFRNCSTLSMGMSSDFRIAVEEGSTLLRIGTALFGEKRP